MLPWPEPQILPWPETWAVGIHVILSWAFENVSAWKVIFFCAKKRWQVVTCWRSWLFFFFLPLNNCSPSILCLVSLIESEITGSCVCHRHTIKSQKLKCVAVWLVRYSCHRCVAIQKLILCPQVWYATYFHDHEGPCEGSRGWESVTPFDIGLSEINSPVVPKIPLYDH